MVENNVAYRICFKEGNSNIKQYFKDYSFEEFEILNFNDIDELRNFLKNVTFDLFSDSPVRLAMFKLNDNSGGFLCSIHHSISDAWSMAFLIENVLKYYYNLLNNVNEKDTHLYSYVDFIN